MSKKLMGFILNLLIVILMSLPLLGIDMPLPSSTVGLMFTTNAIFAFVSIFLQRLVIVLYEANVYEKPNGIISYTFKYFAIFTSGMNYYIQNVLNRLPFFMNKMLAIIFFLYVSTHAFILLGVYE